MINKDKKDRVVRQFVTYCRMALRYEKINYYNERKRMAERESHMEMFSEKQLETVDKIFDTYHADYFYVMGYEIGIVDGDLAQALRELSDRQLQIVLMYYFIGWTDREIGGINVVNLSHSYSFLHSRKKFKKFSKNLIKTLDRYAEKCCPAINYLIDCEVSICSRKTASVRLLKMLKTLLLLLRLKKSTVSKKLPLQETESFHSRT